MRERLGAGDVVDRGARCRGDVEDPLGGHVEKTRFLVDKTPDQPRTGDAIDLWPLAGHPAAAGVSHLLAKRQAEIGPAGDAPFEISSINPAAARSGSGLLAYLVAVDAIDDDRSAGR